MAASTRVVRAALAAAVALGLLVPAGSAPATASPSPLPAAGSSTQPSAGPTAGPTNGPGEDESEPSAEEVAAEQRRAEALLEEVRKATAKVDEVNVSLNAASQAASLALEQYTSAQERARAAVFEADRQNDLLLQAQLTVSAQKAVLGRWARQAYGGDELSQNPALVTILEGGSTDDLGRAMSYLQRVGNSKGRAVEEYEAAMRRQAQATADAEAARTAAEDANQLARLAKENADAAVAEQRDRLAEVEAELAAAQDAAAAADSRAKNLAAARAVARARALAGGGSNAVTGQVGDCRGSDVSGYANGQIPIAALCPLWGTANQFLRADAAYAFDRLSQAYAQKFGEPICVTDSYRDYDTQVRLYATKPNLAAVPGTSNHGWGRAVDLCGGIQSFGTTTHDWMLANAPQFGWFHPAWAEPSGSRPEPWHWEFAG